MTQSNQPDKDFGVLQAQEPTGTPRRPFEADIPSGSKKEAQPHDFGSDFAPAKESRPAKKSTGFQNEDTPVQTKTDRAPPSEPVKRTPGPSTQKVNLPLDKGFEMFRLAVILLVFLPLTVYAFWPSVQSMVHAWATQMDYGHGILVLPLVVLFCYLRWDTYPGTYRNLTWIGLMPVLVCFGMRLVSAGQLMEALDQWSIIFWVFGIVWFFYGSRVFLWALPSLSYLVFMFQLPWRQEVLMRNHLQQFAAQCAAGMLQILGEPAIAIKNTIRLSTEELAVETSCSGIRFLVSILAIAFAAILLMKRSWWQNILVILIAPPLALFVNAARIAMTGILIVHFSDFLKSVTPEGQSHSAFADEIAGLTMIFVAIGFFLLFLWYLGKVFRKVEI